MAVKSAEDRANKKRVAYALIGGAIFLLVCYVLDPTRKKTDKKVDAPTSPVTRLV